MQGNRPNIIVILSDDQGPWALGCAGNDEIITPNLDRLAAEGTRLDQFYCASPVCSPARATLLTGQIPSQHGIHDWIRGGSMATGERPAIRYLDGKPSYTQVLAENGYTCGLSGKWHLGNSMVPQHGFSHWYTHQEGGGPYHGAPMIRDGEPVTEPGYLTEAIMDDALAFIDAHHRERDPFYLSVHFTAPHSPWIDSHPREYLELYADCAFDSIPRDPVHPWSVPGLAPEPGSDLWRAQLQGYFAAVTAMDANIGRILDRLDEHAIAEDTIVWFLSDNGFSAGHRGIWGKGNATFPLNMWDNSVRVPAIARYPGVIPAGAVRTEMVSAYDFPHTLLAQVGLVMPNAEELPGRAFTCLFDPQNTIDRDHVVILDEYGPVRMIRTPAWKYVHRYPYGPHELYDMAHDPGERVNLVDDPAKSEIVTLLRGELQRWFTRYVDPAVDGAHEQVTGSGQLGLAGTGNAGALAYDQSQRIAKEAEQSPRPKSGT